jgi:hypothetical protein
MHTSNRFAPLSFFEGEEGKETDYTKYKRLGDEIHKLLDPEKELQRRVKFKKEGQQGRVKFNNAIAQLVDRLSATQQDRLSSLLQEAISLRNAWSTRFSYAPSWKQDNHAMYIEYFEGILNVCTRNKLVTVDAEEPHQEDKEVGDDESDLGPAQVDFLAFLDDLMAMARTAADLWDEVALGDLPIWTASIRECISHLLLVYTIVYSALTAAVFLVSGVILRQVDHLIHESELLSGLGSSPWVTTKFGHQSSPQLTQEWVSALDKACGKGTMWREMSALVPQIMDCIDSMLYVARRRSVLLLDEGFRRILSLTMPLSAIGFRVCKPLLSCSIRLARPTWLR